MTTLFIRHKMKDYATWKKVYDNYDKKGDGVTRASVHRDSENPKMIVVAETFPNITAARAHVNSDKLKNAMAQAGVEGSPEFWFTENVEDVKL